MPLCLIKRATNHYNIVMNDCDPDHRPRKCLVLRCSHEIAGPPFMTQCHGSKRRTNGQTRQGLALSRKSLTLGELLCIP